MILCNITNVKGKWSINTPLSIAMFVYQRVYHGISHENPIKSRQNPMTSLWNPMKPLSIPWNHYKYPMNPKNGLPGATYDLGSPFPGFTPSTWAAASRLLVASKIPKLRDISVVYFPLGFPLGFPCAQWGSWHSDLVGMYVTRWGHLMIWEWLQWGSNDPTDPLGGSCQCPGKRQGN